MTAGSRSRPILRRPVTARSRHPQGQRPQDFEATFVGAMEPAFGVGSWLTGLDLDSEGTLVGIETAFPYSRIFEVPTVAPFTLVTLLDPFDLEQAPRRAYSVATVTPTSAWFVANTDNLPGIPSSHTNARTLWLASWGTSPFQPAPESAVDCYACTTAGADGYLDLVLKFSKRDLVAGLGESAFRACRVF